MPYPLNKSEYYFISLGREPGGLLEVLNLPPTADERQVKNAVHGYIQRLKDETIEMKNVILKNDLLDEEEREKKVKQLDEDFSEKNAELNALREKAKSEFARKREQKRSGIREYEFAWSTLYEATLEFEDFEKFYLKSLSIPLPQTEHQKLTELTQGFSNDNFQKALKDKNLTLAHWMERILWNKMKSLLVADQLWSNLKYTNTQYWNDQIQAWEMEFKSFSDNNNRRTVSDQSDSFLKQI